jgi:hypothetical protein
MSSTIEAAATTLITLVSNFKRRRHIIVMRKIRRSQSQSSFFAYTDIRYKKMKMKTIGISVIISFILSHSKNLPVLSQSLKRLFLLD